MSTITLPNIRVGSDLQVRVRLKDGGVAIDWSTLSNIKACIYSDAQRALAGRCAFSIDEEDSTLLVCTYAANKPQYLGVNRIVISAKYMGETKTYDKPAFSFVRWTADQEGEEITIDDPDVDVEIDVEDISSSILQEAVDAAFTAADRANDAAAAAEHMVDIHTGPEGKSAYEVAVEEGYTGTEEEWLASLKGDTGETPDISIGTVTTVAPGTPASASMTGTPEEPVLNLSIPQGIVGATPNFTVGTVTTGEPGSSVIVTITGTPEAPVLNLTIPQGMQGNTGSSVEFPYELVNNLTTNDATKGLSAAQGVVLDGKVSQLEAEVTSFGRECLSSGATEKEVTPEIGSWSLNGYIDPSPYIRAHLKISDVSYRKLQLVIPNGWYAYIYYINSSNASQGEVLNGWQSGTITFFVNGDYGIMCNIKYGSAGTTTIDQTLLDSSTWKAYFIDKFVPATPFPYAQQLGKEIVGINTYREMFERSAAPVGSMPIELVVGVEYNLFFTVSESQSFAITLRSADGWNGPIVQTIASSQSWGVGEHIVSFVYSAGTYLRLGESANWPAITNISVKSTLKEFETGMKTGGNFPFELGTIMTDGTNYASTTSVRTSVYYRIPGVNSLKVRGVLSEFQKIFASVDTILVNLHCYDNAKASLGRTGFLDVTDTLYDFSLYPNTEYVRLCVSLRENSTTPITLTGYVDTIVQASKNLLSVCLSSGFAQVYDEIYRTNETIAEITAPLPKTYKGEKISILNGYNIVDFGSYPNGVNPTQALAISGNYCVQGSSSESGGKTMACIIDLATRTKVADLLLSHDGYAGPHCNLMCFGKETISGGIMPLLYASQWDGEECCFVYDIQLSGATLKQVISPANLTRDGVRFGVGYTDWIVDTDHGWLFAISYKNSGYSTGGQIITKFALPKVSDGELIELSDNDILAYNDFGDYIIRQDGCYNNGRILLIYGSTGQYVPYLALHAIDVFSLNEVSTIDLQYINAELEGLDVYNGVLVLHILNDATLKKFVL